MGCSASHANHADARIAAQSHLGTHTSVIHVQAYGARQFSLVGVSLQRGSLICALFFCMMLPVWLNFEPLMIAMGAPRIRCCLMRGQHCPLRISLTTRLLHVLCPVSQQSCPRILCRAQSGVVIAGQQAGLAAGAARYMRLLIPSLFFGGDLTCMLQLERWASGFLSHACDRFDLARCRQQICVRRCRRLPMPEQVSVSPEHREPADVCDGGLDHGRAGAQLAAHTLLPVSLPCIRIQQ